METKLHHFLQRRRTISSSVENEDHSVSQGKYKGQFLVLFSDYLHIKEAPFLFLLFVLEMGWVGVGVV